jgi:CspA family cold shock protein
MQTGTIKRIMDKGFGFIGVEGNEKDTFFHANEVVDTDFASLKEGDTVTFEMEDSDRGPQAVKVTLVA